MKRNDLTAPSTAPAARVDPTAPAPTATTPSGDDGDLPRLPDGALDTVAEASIESFPASDAPAWTPDHI